VGNSTLATVVEGGARDMVEASDAKLQEKTDKSRARWII
jgi:hypothetical protein